MNRHPSQVLILLCSLCWLRDAQGSEPVTVEGKVSAVTVYQGQALVTREVEIPGGQGLLEVVVTNLPEHVLSESLFAEPIGAIDIRSVRYRARPIEEDVREEVREFDVQIQDLQDKMMAIQQERQVLNERKNYLNQLQQFTAVTSHNELKSGVLNAETLKEISEFAFEQRAKIASSELELNKSQRETQKELELLGRRRSTIAAGSSRTVREAVVFVNMREAGATTLRLSYLVSNASWTPSYNVRAANSREEVSVEYNASVQQMSGENWNDVEMILSTATPSLVAKAPKLESLSIKLAAVEQQEIPALEQEYLATRRQIDMLSKMRGGANANAPASDGLGAESSAQQAAPTGGFGGRGGGVGGWAFNASDTKQADEVLNRAAVQLQLMDFNNSISELKRDKATTKNDEGVSVSYELANRTSLPSRSDRQLIQIAVVPLKGEFYRLATPVLTSFIYEEARLTNSSNQVFLAGPVATFLGGEFVGRGEMPTVAVGESFTVGLGIDASLRAVRELVNKEESIQGGNRVVDFTYELRLENFGDKETKVRLLDRLPTVGEDDIEVTLVKSDELVSKDETYLMKDRKEGILRWDIEIPGQAIGTKQKVLKYTMQIEYDKQLAIVGMPAKK